MDRLDLDFDPYANEPGRWGASLLNDAELLIACLDAARARSVVEVGAYAGDLTGLLLQWAARGEARVWAIDPSPQKELVALDEQRADLELVRATSHEALRTIPLPDAAIIDGDHNYYTVSEELRIIGERVKGARLPLLLFHDVCWPHARRDDYFAPDEIPAEHRQPTAEGGGLFPGEPGVRSGGLPYRWPAAREGGPRNGVLTAVEDFVAGRDGLRLAVVPAFFGLGVVWDRDAPWAADLARVVDPWDRNPLLERLEANRVLHLASSLHAHQRAGRQEAVLRRLLDSRAFSIAERLSRLRRRAGIATETSVVSKDDIRRALGES
jgi:SAM-dependent methyltransferase